MGDSTLVDLWIEGKFRAITVSREAIESYLRLPAHRAEVLSEDDRREFVRTHLSLVVNAATARLQANPGAEAIVIDRFVGVAPAAAGDRRSGDRRKGDRRKRNLGSPTGIERRGK
jgi:hypothetical protein